MLLKERMIELDLEFNTKSEKPIPILKETTPSKKPILILVKSKEIDFYKRLGIKICDVTEKHRDLAELIRNKKYIAKGIYTTSLHGEEFLVDGINGECLTKIDGVYTKRYTCVGRGKYVAVRLRDSFNENKSIRLHLIIDGICNSGFATLKAVGSCRTHEVHHIVSWRKEHNSRSKNLILLTIEEHKKIHKKQGR